MDKHLTFRRYLSIVLAIAALTFSVGAIAGETLKFGYVIRPGMAEMVNGVPTGTYLPLADAIARAAHLQIQWLELPQTRLIEEVRANASDYCAVGIYKTEERLHFAKYSDAFFHDKPLVIITLKSKEAAIRKHPSFAMLAADSSLRIGLINGYSYGARIDPILSNMRNADRFSGSTVQNVSKLMAGRFDYILGSSEESPHTVQGAHLDDRDFARIEFADLAPGEARHFMCSANVEDATIERLNAGIKALHRTVGR